MLAVLAAATIAAPNNPSTSAPPAPSSSPSPASSAPATSSAPASPSSPSTPPATSSSTPATTSASTPPAPPTTSAPASSTAPGTTSASSPPAAPSAPAGGPDTGTCTTGALQCCDSVLSANSTAISPILGLLGVVLEDLDVPIGLSCSGITGVGVGSGNACSSNAVWLSVGGVIAIGCLPVSL